MVTHRINRVEFELEVNAVELGRRLSDRVSVLHGQRIPSLLDRVCTEVDASESIDRIDTLELDLGRITLSNFDADLLAKLEAALRVALRGRSGRSRRSIELREAPRDESSTSESIPAPEPAHRSSDARELLDVYAWTGNLPWWADAHDPGVLATHVRHLLLHAPEIWNELLREHADDRVGLDRLARICNDELLELILQRAGAVEALDDLRALEQPLTLAGVRRDRWRASLLAALGRHGRIDPAAVLPAVLRELDDAGLAALLDRIDEQPEFGTAFVRAALALARSRLDRSRIQLEKPSERIDSPTAARAKSEPSHEPTTSDDPTSIPPRPSPSHETIENEIHEPHEAEPPDPEHIPPRADTRPSTRPIPAKPLPPTLPDAEARLQLARRRALAKLDELYIDDAGLVILWPFLERLFTRVELLDKRQFRDEPAQTTAIALLAYLAFEHPEPPEHRLAFAKLLCGRSPEHPCEFDGPLSPELRDECDHMLAAVIDHAPVLDSMPIPQFRSSFLQRAGALSVRTGSWLLSVERQPYDLVLDRFSWSWAWLKLPWMPEPLTVEW